MGGIPPAPDSRRLRILAVAGALLIAGATGTLLSSLGGNTASTRPDHPDPALRTRQYNATRAEVVNATLAAAHSLPRWTVVAADDSTGRMRLEHKTAFWGFVDDVELTIQPGSQGSRVDATSRSRVGSLDFGQNAANLRELLGGLDEALTSIA